MTGHDLPKSTFTVVKTYGDVYSIGLSIQKAGSLEEIFGFLRTEGIEVTSQFRKELKKLAPGQIQYCKVEGGKATTFTPHYIYSHPEAM